MKYILSILSVALLSAVSFGQTDSTAVGKVVYYEGKVELGVDPSFASVKINAVVKNNQTIKTLGDAMAEIVWNNGTKTIVGPNSKQTVSTLQKGTTSAAKTETQGVFNGFKTKVNATGASKRTEEGGIRRTDATEQETGENGPVYWKEEKEILFSEAYAFYEAGEYAKAIAALQAFINQKPKDEMTKFAKFALGHSYIMMNNNDKAKEIFEKFLADYPSDTLKADAEEVLAKL
ncbi:MAG: tetratricopeptide repeat protein [Flavobacteriales bacterium]